MAQEEGGCSGAPWRGVEGRGVSFMHLGECNSGCPRASGVRTGGCARFGGGVNWVELEPSFVMAVKH